MRVKKKMNNLLGQIKTAAYNDEVEKIAVTCYIKLRQLVNTRRPMRH